MNRKNSENMWVSRYKNSSMFSLCLVSFQLCFIIIWLSGYIISFYIYFRHVSLIVFCVLSCWYTVTSESPLETTLNIFHFSVFLVVRFFGFFVVFPPSSSHRTKHSSAIHFISFQSFFICSNLILLAYHPSLLLLRQSQYRQRCQTR